jgi:hypothetical protein
MNAPIITLLTDFGTDDPFVGTMKGVILAIAPAVRIVDLTHAVAPQDVRTGALLLRSAVPYFPAATIHVAVVDPGVGSARRAIVVETADGLLIGPDNGLLSLASTALGRRSVRSLDNPAFFRQPVSRTFHGRDIFAPAAAHLASGARLDEVGAPLDGMVEISLPLPRQTPAGLVGEVLYADRFGNLVTNIDADALGSFPAQDLSVSIGQMRIDSLADSYAAVAEGALLAILNSAGLLEVAVRNGNAACALAVAAGTPVTVQRVMR